MSGCHPTETSEVCKHNKPIKAGCSECYFATLKDDEEENIEQEKSSPMVKQIQLLEARFRELEKDAVTHKCPICDGIGINCVIDQIHGKINKLQEHKNYQIDENRKASRRMEESEEKIKMLENSEIQHFKNYKNWIIDLEKQISFMAERLNDIETSIRVKYPHVCPSCKGFGSPHIESTLCAEGPRKHHLSVNPCHSCQGKGIVWG